MKNDIWTEITQNVNATGSGQMRSVERVKLRWKNLKAKATKDHAEAKKTVTGNKPFKRGDYTDVVLDLIGASSHLSALHLAENSAVRGVTPQGAPQWPFVWPGITFGQNSQLQGRTSKTSTPLALNGISCYGY
ncbi:hypothetical protein AAFF_G00162050 [Aldrovandia affinis]|uniref:Myb/SANT-like DNA-binding domain-containing protein n=1 Tax=Aldrovandia affinis TaxID=143900 RepID=A0AAD7W884_9TELE|nr:hypothetical protein AAFF_G00162050 [Aldrovandia affinis]